MTFPAFPDMPALWKRRLTQNTEKRRVFYDDVPELHDSLKDAMAALLVTAATLERSYQEALDADKSSPEWRLQMNELNKLHLSLATWLGPLRRFVLAHPLGH